MPEDAASPLRRVERVVEGQPTSDGAGVRLLRVLGGDALPELDPFLLLDEFRSDEPGDYIAGFPEHPHRGFETVTYMLAGRMRHEDSQGNRGLIDAGGVQWMTAGRGIFHAEMPEQTDGLMWGFQLWVNLPARAKMTAPRYQDIASADVPEARRADGVTVRVLAGSHEGVAAAVGGIAADPVYLDVHLPPGRAITVTLPPAHNAFLYCYEGEAGVGDVAVGCRRLAVLTHGGAVRLETGAHGARALVAAGRPFGEPVARYGPFVMNTREELVQAIADLREGRF